MDCNGASNDTSNQPRERLFIKEMIMENFKSYAGEQRVGPFHKSFSAVVGPNGSGKSNVIDAMLFVFGKRAKQMRLNKVSELIHNSTNHQNLDKASVSVHFQEIIDLDGENYEPVKGSDFVVTRVAFRDNSSKYYINNRGSNFTEVTKKLRAKGVDLDNNRFLILQGEVEQISLMKPKSQGPHDEGFLEYLEDIIGSNKYVERIEEASKQLEVLNENRSGIVQRVKLAEKEKDSLEGAKNEAEAFMLKEAELFKWQEKATELALKDANDHISELKENITKLEENLKEEKEKFKQNSKAMKELEATHNKHLKRQDELETKLKACKDEFKEFERQDVKYREDLKHIKQKGKKLEEKIEKDSAKIEEIEKESEESTLKIPKLEEVIVKLSESLTEEEKLLEKIKESSKEETEKHRTELVNVRAELEPWEKQQIECKGKLDVASSESKLLKEKHEAGRKAYEEAKSQMTEIKKKIKDKEVDLQNMQSAIEKNKLIAAEARKEEHTCTKEEESIASLEQTARQKVSELRAILESEKSQGSVLKAILQAKDSNKIQGIYGRLGDLGAIDAKYDVAVSTACGGLDFIVVETTSSAQACVELLRSKNLGIATFMILEKQENHLQRIKEKVRTPEGVPRLFDLITVQDERIKLAFYAALGNTVVAKDLDQATRIAYGQDKEFRRVVTLDGAVFEKSGTMSGGGGKPQGGRMGTSIKASSVSGEAIASAEKELENLVDRLRNIQQRISAAVKQYQGAEKAMSHLELDLAKTRMEIEGLNGQHADIEKQLDSLKSAAQASKNELERLKELDQVITNEEKELASLVKGSKKLKEKAAELQNKIENAGGEKLQKQKSKVAKLQGEIDKSSTEINRRKVQITTGKKTIQKLQKAIEESTKEKDRVADEKEKKTAAFKEIEQKAFLVQENYKKTQEVLDAHNEEVEKAKNEYNALKKVLDELRSGEVDVQYKLEDIKKIFKDWEAKGKGYSKKLEELNKALEQHIEQIRIEGIDPALLQATLGNEQFLELNTLETALEKVALLQAQLKELKPSLDSIQEYRRKAALYSERVEELNTITLERDDRKRQYDELRKKRLDEFMLGFNTISLKLKEMYQMITLGGDAELELVDSLDPFAEGVVFSVRPPKKSWKNIANLSGGEKTLSSLALVFALHHYKPTPLYVMDEIDAALDFKNVSIVGHYIKDRTKDAQFIIISLRNNMFELADRLIGIYKTDNCTKSVTINPRSFAVSASCS
ncbi:hypothetical protein SUGI_0182570 [Cryptomeria japonica]|uniref:structural maintenance of chromosomes protein 4 n=1 Tax=Cryptomeria japonica TaxID=3369 RepID=UPI002408A926|nr:structural maintenance of chromosomes protein 4 [Cryptomeria japonica]GLJ12037.1 hypothetical protein SUGI_0182570 [Cryptomeria japonica]